MSNFYTAPLVLRIQFFMDQQIPNSSSSSKLEPSKLPFKRDGELKLKLSIDESPFAFNEPHLTGIKILISGSTQIRSGISSHTLYHIEGSDECGQFKVERRYSNFLTLIDFLTQVFPCTFIPGLPAKKAIGNQTKAFIERRTRYLQIFVERVALKRHLYYSQYFQFFLRGEGDLKDECQALFMNFSYVKHIKLLKNTFFFESEHLSEDDLASNQQFVFLLKKLKNNLMILLPKVEDQSPSESDHFLEAKNILEEFQSHVLAPIKQNYNFSLIQLQNIGTQSSLFEDFATLLKIQLMDINQFLNSIQMLIEYEKMKHNALKYVQDQKHILDNIIYKLKTHPSEQSLIQEQNRKITRANEDVVKISSIINLMQIILCQHEIDNFKKQQKTLVHRLLRHVSLQQIQAIKDKKQKLLIFKNSFGSD